MKITLYDYWRSSAAYRLRIAFALAKLDFNSISIDLVKGDHKAADNIQRNPQGLVPTVEIDDQTLTQSLAIIEYLHDAGYYYFLPQSVLGRAKTRALAYAIAMEIHPVCNLSVAKFASDNSGGNISMKSWMQHFIPKGFDGVEKMLDSSGKYCVGDQLTIADVCLVPQMYNAQRWEIDMSPFPNIQRVFDNLKDIPEVSSAHPDNFKPDV